MGDPKEMDVIEPKNDTKFTHSEAMEYYNEASRLLEKYRPEKPARDALPFTTVDAFQNFISSSSVIFVPTLIYWFISPIILTDFPDDFSYIGVISTGVILNSLLASTIVGLGILSWNGNPKKKIRSFLSNIFLTKKAKKKIAKYLKDRSDYENSVKLFEIYVQNTRKILNESGVMKALDESSGGNVHYYVTDDGHMRSEVKGVKNPVTDSKKSLNSSQKIVGMTKELVQSISVKQSDSNVAKVKL